MEYLLNPIVTLASANETFGVPLPDTWIGLAVQRLFLWGVLSEAVRDVERVPVGWIEWLWSWFGYRYFRQEYDLNLEVLRLMFLTLLLAFAIYLVLHTLMDWWLIVFSITHAVISICFGYISESVSCVFRLLASSGPPDKPKVAVNYSGPSLCLAESKREGSELVPLLFPSSQVRIGSTRGEVFTASACGVVIYVNDIPFLLTAEHAVANYPDGFSMLGKTGVVFINLPNVASDDSVSTDREYHQLDTDVVAIRLSPNEVSRAGVAKSPILAVLPSQGAAVSVVGADGGGSVARITHGIGFGTLKYEGSTIGGFSGAGYYCGKQLVGIHLCGGVINGGYSAQCAAITLSYMLNHRPEDTPDFLKKTFQEGTPIYEDETWGHSDSARVRIKGRYHIVERSELYLAKEQTRSSTRGGSYENDAHRDLESKNLMMPSGSGQWASDALLKSTLERFSKELRSTLEQTSSKQKQSGGKSGKKPKNPIAGPPQEPTQKEA